MILVQEFHVLDLRIQINMYDPRSFLALLIGSSEKGQKNSGLSRYWTHVTGLDHPDEDTRHASPNFLSCIRFNVSRYRQTLSDCPF